MNYSKISKLTLNKVNLLIPFTNNYSSHISASELARRTKVPQQTVSRQLNDLVKLNILNYKKIGTNKLFHFELEQQSSKLMFNLIETFKSLEFLSENEAIAVIISDLLECCENLIVFGSYASGKFTEGSDIDVVFLGKCNKEQIEMIKEIRPIKINEHYITKSEFTTLLDKRNPLVLEIKENHVLFGDISQLVKIFWKWDYERRQDYLVFETK